MVHTHVCIRLPILDRKAQAMAANIKQAMPVGSTLVLRNVTVNGHRTSMRLEPEFWEIFDQISHELGITTEDLLSKIRAATRGQLTTAVRVTIALYLKQRVQSADTSQALLESSLATLKQKRS